MKRGTIYGRIPEKTVSIGSMAMPDHGTGGRHLWWRKCETRKTSGMQVRSHRRT